MTVGVGPRRRGNQSEMARRRAVPSLRLIMQPLEGRGGRAPFAPLRGPVLQEEQRPRSLQRSRVPAPVVAKTTGTKLRQRLRRHSRFTLYTAGSPHPENGLASLRQRPVNCLEALLLLPQILRA